MLSRKVKERDKMSEVFELINNRVSASSYVPNESIDDHVIETIISYATKAPSAFNLQNWKFIAVKSDVEKKRLLPIAYNQPKIVDSSVTFIVCGITNPQELIVDSLKPSVEQGILNQDIFDGWVGAVQNMYGNNPQFQRDEAIRSASFAGMTLMLTAQGMGYVSCPMIGFDATALHHEFSLSDNEIPVMLITVGKAGTENWPQKPRHKVGDVLTII